MEDVFQGDAPTCWLLASISSVARTGADFASRIRYLGNDQYAVDLFDSNRTPITVTVNFNGVTNSADPIANPKEEGDSWVILMQRAYLQSRGIDITDPPEGNSYYALEGLTGRRTELGIRLGPALNPADLARITSALAAGKNVVAGTNAHEWQINTDLLFKNHAYTVMRVESEVRQTFFGKVTDWFVVLRNPYGNDTGARNVSWGANDGIVRVGWDQFSRSMSHYYIN
jgi:hypothetical protein